MYVGSYTHRMLEYVQDFISSSHYPDAKISTWVVVFLSETEHCPPLHVKSWLNHGLLKTRLFVCRGNWKVCDRLPGNHKPRRKPWKSWISMKRQKTSNSFTINYEGNHGNLGYLRKDKKYWIMYISTLKFHYPCCMV
jgi:hypothetical protein